MKPEIGAELSAADDPSLKVLGDALAGLCRTADRRALALCEPGPEPDNFMTRASYYNNLEFADTLNGIIVNPEVDQIETLAAQRAEKIVKRATRFNKEDEKGVEGLALSIGVYIAQESYMVDRYRVYKFGKNHPTTAVRAYCDRLSTNAAFLVASMLYGHADRKSLLNTLFGAQEMVADESLEAVSWTGSQVNRFAVEVRSAFSLFDIWLQQDTHTETDPNTESLKSAGDELWKEQKALRRFALKPAIAPSNLPGITNMVLRPGHEVVEMVEGASRKLRKETGTISDPEPTKHALSGAIATVKLSDLSLKRELPPTTIKGSSIHIDMRDIVEADIEEVHWIGVAHVFSEIQLRSNGELYTLSGVPLRRVAETMGAQEAYEQLRLEILALHYDLVVPVYVQKLVKDQLAKGQPPLTNSDRVREMVIARRKYLYEHKEEVVNKLEEEEAQAKLRPKQRGPHPVTGHVRELPPEFSASLEARQLALEEDGRILPEFGLTWVKYHQHGGGKDIKQSAVRVRPVDGKYNARQRSRKAS